MLDKRITTKFVGWAFEAGARLEWGTEKLAGDDFHWRMEQLRVIVRWLIDVYQPVCG